MNDIPSFLQKCFGEKTYPGKIKFIFFTISCHLNLSFLTDELVKFLNYVCSLEYDAAPDYDRCRGWFESGLKKRKYPTDGSLDFSAPATPQAKAKVGKSKTIESPTTAANTIRSPMKPKNSPPKAVRGRRGAKASTNKIPTVVENEENETEEEDEEVVESPKKKGGRKRVAKKTTVIQDSDVEMEDLQEEVVKKRKKAVVSKISKASKMADAASQTSPAFVKAAKAAKRKLEKPSNPDMDEFVEEAKAAAKKATASKGAKSSRAKKGKDDDEGEEDGGMANPTPAMLELMKKREDKPGTFKSTSAATVSNPTPAMLELMAKREAKAAATTKRGRKK